MTTTENESNNVFGALTTAAETLVGAVLAYEYTKLTKQGLSPEGASSLIRNSPAFQGAAKIFGPIGLTATALSAVADAVIDGGQAGDYMKAASL